MALDPSIYSQIQQPAQVNPLAQLAQASQIQGAQQQNRLAQLQMQEYERARQQDEAARGVYAGFGADTTANQQSLYKAGLGKEALAYGKNAAEAQKAATEQQAAQFKLAYEKSTALRNIIGGVKDQAGYTQGLKSAEALGLDVSNEPAIYNPAYVENLAQQALTQQQRIEAELKNRGFDVTMRGQDITRQNSVDSNATARANNSATVGATIRGQNLTDARQREANVGGRVPSGYRQLADGSLEFIPGGPADPANKAGGGKPLTEGQSKSLVFASRMQEANDTLDKLSSGGTVNSIPGSTVPGVGAVVNALGGANNQQLVQAKRDFINAVLRRESGAAIASSEFDNADKQYFPQIGDSAAVIAQKKRNREIATRGIAADVPDAENRINSVRGSTPATGGWSVKEVR